ncbi:hypothetical protein K7432_002080 [Basidiobolus ranarum]
MSSALKSSYASTSSQSANPSQSLAKPEIRNSTQNSADFGSFGFDSNNLFLTKPYPNPNLNTTTNSKTTESSRDRALPGVFSLTKPPEAMNYSGERHGPVNESRYSQNHQEYNERSSNSSYSEASSRYDNHREPPPASSLSRLGADLHESNIPYRRHSVAGLPGASYSFPLPHGSGHELPQPSSLSNSFTAKYSQSDETEKGTNGSYYSSTDSPGLKRKEFNTNPVHVPASAFKRRSSLCDPLPPLPSQISGFSGPSRTTNDGIGSAAGSLKLPKIEEIEGYSSEYSEKSSPSGYDGALPHHRLLDRPAFRNEHFMGRRASLPVISLPHQNHGNERSYGGPGESDHSSYVFPPPSDDDKISPYSRTPALKVSHKLAERKRRKEMKELFDELRDNIPVEKSVKTSKWEILSKSIEYIRQLHEGQDKMNQEVQDLRQQVAILKQGRR